MGAWVVVNSLLPSKGVSQEGFRPLEVSKLKTFPYPLVGRGLLEWLVMKGL